VIVHINYGNLFQCGNVNVKQFLEYLYEHPHDVTKCMSIALDNMRFFNQGIADQRIVVVRFTNFNQVFPLSMIKSHLINKFICLRGTVLRVSSIKVLVDSI
jgi:DNA replicative helicase MCM subunit Mcm2 (Cdc46/Mcm family)